MKRLLLALAFLLWAPLVQAQFDQCPSGLCNITGRLQPFAYDLNFVDSAGLGSCFASGVSFPCTNATNTRNSPEECVDSSGIWHAAVALQNCITNLGIWSWEGRTNSIRVSDPSGATNGVIGTGGLVPANWSISWPSGLTATLTKTTLNGLPAISLNFAGTTTSGASQIAWQADTNTQIAAASGQVWTYSAQFQVTQDDPSVSTIVAGPQGIGPGPSVTEANTLVFYSGRLTSQRAQASIALANVSTTSIRGQWSTNTIPNATLVNFTVVIAAPQLELVPSATTAAQGFPTPPILTTSGALARAADSISMAVNPASFASGIGLWALATSQVPAGAVGSGVAAEISQDANNRLRVFRSFPAGTAAAQEVITGTATGLTLQSWAQGVQGKIAVFAASNTLSAKFNGGAPSTGAPTGLTPVSKLFVGVAVNGAPWNGSIARIIVDPNDLTNR